MPAEEYPHPRSDHGREVLEVGARPVAVVLRIGGSLGAAIVLVGLVVALAQNGAAWVGGPSGDLLGGGAALTLSDLAGGLRHGQAAAVILLGMVVLAATPALGVATAGLWWLRARRPWLAAVSAVVLTLLVVAGSLGAAG